MVLLSPLAGCGHSRHSKMSWSSRNLRSFALASAGSITVSLNDVSNPSRSRDAAEPSQPREPFLQTPPAACKPPEPPLPRAAPHLRDPSALEERPSQARPGTARARKHLDHAGYLLPRALRHVQACGRDDGQHPPLAGNWHQTGINDTSAQAEASPRVSVFPANPQKTGVAGPGFEPGTP